MVRGWWSAIVLSFWWSILSKSPQQIFSANLLSRFSQQIFSASSQQIFSADHLRWSGVGGQLLSYHLPCHLLWSGVGGQLLSYHFGGLCCMSSLEGPFRGAFGKNGKIKSDIGFEAKRRPAKPGNAETIRWNDRISFSGREKLLQVRAIFCWHKKTYVQLTLQGSI